MYSMETEEWRPVRGYEGLYEVSNQGRVKSLGRRVKYGVEGSTRSYETPERILRTSSDARYAAVILCNDGGKKRKLVHRLVAEAFIPNPDGKPFVLHWDDDPQNNHIENLRWGTHSENMRDSIRNGTHHEARKTHCLRGHEFTDENIRWSKNRTGKGRWCKECQKQRRKSGLPPEDPRHGTTNGYYNRSCRCDLCIGAMRAAEGVRNPRKVENPTCKRGHPRTEENVYVDKRGSRHCRPCAAMRMRNRRNRLEASGGAIKFEVNGE